MQRCHNYKINCGVKISKENCKISIEIFVKIQKKMGGGGGGGGGPVRGVTTGLVGGGGGLGGCV